MTRDNPKKTRKPGKTSPQETGAAATNPEKAADKKTGRNPLHYLSERGFHRGGKDHPVHWGLVAVGLLVLLIALFLFSQTPPGEKPVSGTPGSASGPYTEEPEPADEFPEIENSEEAGASSEEQAFAEEAVEENASAQPNKPSQEQPQAARQQDKKTGFPFFSSKNDELETLHARINRLEELLSRQVTALQKILPGPQGENQDAFVARQRLEPLIIATMQLRERIENGLPYATDLTIIKRLGKFDGVILETVINVEETLKDNVYTYAQLQSSFDALIHDVILAERRAQSEGWWDSVKLQFLTVFKIRRVGEEVMGESAEAIMARAEVFLHNGQLDRAIGEVSNLTESARGLTLDWLDHARRYLKVNTLLNVLLQRVTSLALEDEHHNSAEHSDGADLEEAPPAETKEDAGEEKPETPEASGPSPKHDAPPAPRQPNGLPSELPNEKIDL